MLSPERKPERRPEQPGTLGLPSVGAVKATERQSRLRARFAGVSEGLIQRAEHKVSMLMTEGAIGLADRDYATVALLTSAAMRRATTNAGSLSVFVTAIREFLVLHDASTAAPPAEG